MNRREFTLMMLAPVFLAAVPSAGVCAETVESLEKRFFSMKTFEANFSQQKFLTGQNRSLHSSGRVYIDARRGVLWDQTEPFSQRIMLNEKRISISIEGDEPEEWHAKDDPLMFGFISIFSSLFTGKLDDLKKGFHIENPTGTADNWQVTLTPASLPIQKLFRAVVLKGDVAMREVELFEATGDRMLIELTGRQLNKPLPERILNALKQ